MLKIVLLLIFCVVLVCADPPLSLGSTTFKDIIGSEQTFFVKFFAPWCGHCKRLAPTWELLAETFSGTSVTIAKVDCTVETELCAEQGVRSYPTLKLYVPNDVHDYTGSRDIQSLKDFVIDNAKDLEEEKNEKELPNEEESNLIVDDNGLAQLTDNNFEIYLNNNRGVHFVKFYAPWCGHCQRLAPTWDELAAHYATSSSVFISKVDCTVETNTCQKNGVKGYPTLLLFEDGLVVQKYSGSRNLNDLVNFVDENMPKDEDAPIVGVVQLTTETFSRVTESGKTFVKFYAPWCGHCKKLAPTWDELASTINPDVATIAKVDCTVERELCSANGVGGYPTLIVFQDGAKIEEYRGARDLESLSQFINTNF